jgi:hypothetical protein
MQLPVYVCPSSNLDRLSATGDNPDNGGAHVPGALGSYAACGGDYGWQQPVWYDGYGGGAQTGSSHPVRANGAMLTSDLPYAYPVPQPLATPWMGRITLSNLKDGTSNTMLFGEKHLNPSGSGWGYGSIYNGDHDANFIRHAGPGYPIAPHTRNTTFSARPYQCFGSSHPGIALFAMGDGRAIMLSAQVDTSTLRRLAVRNDGEAVELPK